MIKASIIGVTGYTGIELLRLLQHHLMIKIKHVFTENHVGEDIAEVYPHLKDQIQLCGEKLNLDLIINDSDVVFISLPHGHALEIVPPLLAAGKKIIDLGADFRLKNREDYSQWYQAKPADKSVLEKAVYGLPEAGKRELLTQASLIANPGCYPTASILAAMPLLKANLIHEDECIFDAKSGISGAGRSLSLKNHFCEATENAGAYQLAGAHRHTPEIEQELSLISQKNLRVQFTPHLIPVIRGMLVTAYFKLKKPMPQKEISDVFHTNYANETFIRICNKNQTPQIKNVRGTNYCDIGVCVDERTNRVIVVSAIDNLIKGAAGQAIQNMNLMYQFPETMGLLTNLPIYP